MLVIQITEDLLYVISSKHHSDVGLNSTADAVK